MNFNTYSTPRAKLIKGISDIGLFIGFVIVVISAVIILVDLVIMADKCGTVSFSDQYDTFKYQQYLLDHPGTELYVGGTLITPYVNKRFSTPFVLKLKTSGGKIYEVFVENDRTEIIGKKLLASVEGGFDNVLRGNGYITFSVRKDESVIAAERTSSFKKAKRSAWFWCKILTGFIILIIRFQKNFVMWYMNNAYPAIRNKIYPLLKKASGAGNKAKQILKDED